MYMEQNMKPITKQLAIAALILTSVTIMSFGIRHVRFSVHRANTVIAETEESTPSARSSNPEGQSQHGQPLGANAEPDHYLADLHTADTKPDHYPADSITVDAEPDPQHANASDSDKEAPSDNYSKAKAFKGDYARSEGSKDLEKISLSDNENLYITGEGELWYVSKEADGSTTKMQVQVDNIGEMTIVDGGNYARSGGSKGLQRIPVGDYEDLYLTGEGELWYTSEQPDGSTEKVQLEEDIVGEITIVDDGKD